MKNLKRIMLICVAFATLIGGCKKDNLITSNNSDSVGELTIYEFKSNLKNNLNIVANKLREQKSNFSSSKNVMVAFNEVFDEEQRFMTYDSYVKLNNSVNLSDGVKRVVNSVDEKIQLAISHEAFLKVLHNQLSEIYSSNLSVKDKRFLEIYLTSFQVSISFLADNQDLIKSISLKASGWWRSWGRCAASILGGAITGATSGVLGGAAVGTVVLPVVGTVSGSVVGAIGGGIGGAVTGAVAAC